jgi:alkanesulfonate monooxygenase SsuD/methylene tetrahydromethanopterin reductase-like flavin-dependent oxidoreductase (luciferase family)
VRRGVLLSTFRRSPRDALVASDDAVDAGIDGVFAYDHLWPMGSPDRPAIAPFEVLTAVAQRHPELTVGTLVARIGVVDDDILLSQCRALRLVAEGRVVIGLGTGDKLSAAENLAYGIGIAPPEVRRASLRRVAGTLLAEGTEVWIGSGSVATNQIAADVGCALNLWDAQPADVEEAATRSQVTWAGPAPRHDGEVDASATASLLAELDGAGAAWAVFAPQTPVELVAR